MIYCISDNVISPLGETTEENYQAVKTGHSALKVFQGEWNLPEPFTASLFSQEQTSSLAIKGMSRFDSLVIKSVSKAINDSGIDPSQSNVVFILGTTKGNIELLQDGKKPPLELYLGNTANRIATAVGISTQSIVTCNACISGVSAIILAMRLLDAGYYDYAVVCGADVQNKFTISGFQSLSAVSQQPCKPFDLERLGLNPGEAAATMVLASDRLLDSKDCCNWCIEKGAVRNDAFHVTSPSKNGHGAWLALCETDFGKDNDQLAFINAHGTATMFNDQMESVAIERAGLQTVPVNAIKGYYGHTMGAAGVLETIIAMHSIDDHTVLGTRGFSELGVSGKIHLSNENQPTEKSSFIKMISGFGGNNAALFVSKENQSSHGPVVLPEIKRMHNVIVTPNNLAIDGEIQKVVLENNCNVLKAIFKQYIGDYPKFYKMDLLSQLAFVASDLLLQAEGNERYVPCDDRAIVLFNHSSSIQADCSYLSTIADDNNFYPSPSLFVYTLPNMAVSEIAIRNQYHGETSLYILPQKDNTVMKQVVQASLLDNSIKSMITGWIDYRDDEHFEADLSIIERIVD